MTSPEDYQEATPTELQALREEWVEALRSGEYEQGNGHLKTVNDEYCCLGVLGDIMGYDGERLLARSNLTNARCIFPFPSLDENYLAEINDADVPFEVIAFIIENWEEIVGNVGLHPTDVTAAIVEDGDLSDLSMEWVRDYDWKAYNYHFSSTDQKWKSV